MLAQRTERNRAVIACGIVLSSLILPGCVTSPKEALLQPEQKRLNIESFDYAWNRVNDTYWDPQFGGVDWQAVRDELRPKVEGALVMSEARAVMNDMVSRLGVSHFAIVPADVYDDVEQGAGGASQEAVTGMDVRAIDGQALVASVVPGSSADRAGVRPGWEILRIGDVDIRARLADLQKKLGDTSRKPGLMSASVLARLMGPIGQSLTVECLDGHDRKVKLTIPLEEETRGRRVAFGYLPPMYVWSEVRWIDGTIGYIGFNAFLDPTRVMKAYNEAMTSFRDAEGVIVDVRGNGGGMHEMITGMMGWLVTETQHPGEIHLRGQELKFLITPRATNYTGPVVVLVDGMSGSAAEVYSGILQDIGRAQVVGSRSAGAVMGAQIERLPNGDGFMYAAVDYVSKSGMVLEGVGVIPDIEVTPTRKALLDGRDPVLKAAIDLIRDRK